MKTQIINTQKLNVNNNKIAVCSVDASVFKTLNSNKDLRKYLVNKYKNELDTVMVVTKMDNQVVKTVVFEPNEGSEQGSFSNMCGNGLRAVAQVTNAEVFLTPAGTFFLEKFEDNSFICIQECLDINSLNGFKIPEMSNLKLELKRLINLPILQVRLCGNSENNNYLGEPHLVVYLKGKVGKDKLIRIAKEFGYKTTYSINRSTQVNVTFVSDFEYKKALACTFERNLGSDSNFAVTGSCGTGAMAAANTLNRFFKLNGGNYIIEFPKAEQHIFIKNNKTYILTTNSYENF